MLGCSSLESHCLSEKKQAAHRVQPPAADAMRIPEGFCDKMYWPASTPFSPTHGNSIRSCPAQVRKLSAASPSPH